MKVPPVWVNRVKFVLGVLFVMGAVAWVQGVWREYHRHSNSRFVTRLETNQLCRVYDTLGDFQKPTPCNVETVEYQQDPSHNRYELEVEWVDYGTIVLCERDDDYVENKPPDGVEHRLVGVQFITGRLSGRQGLVQRHKLQPLYIPY